MEREKRKKDREGKEEEERNREGKVKLTGKKEEGEEEEDVEKEGVLKERKKRSRRKRYRSSRCVCMDALVCVYTVHTCECCVHVCVHLCVCSVHIYVCICQLGHSVVPTLHDSLLPLEQSPLTWARLSWPLLLRPAHPLLSQVKTH